VSKRVSAKENYQPVATKAASFFITPNTGIQEDVNKEIPIPLDKETQEQVHTDINKVVDNNINNPLPTKINEPVITDSPVYKDEEIQQPVPIYLPEHKSKGKRKPASIDLQELHKEKNQLIQQVKAKPVRKATGPIKKATYDLPVNLHKRLKLAALEHDVDMVDIVVKALENYLPAIEK